MEYAPSCSLLLPVRQTAPERYGVYYGALCATGQGKRAAPCAMNCQESFYAALQPHRDTSRAGCLNLLHAQKPGTHQRPVNALQCRGSPARAIFSHCHQRRPHAKTNLKRHRRFTAKKRGEIQHIFAELNAHHRPVVFQRMFLAFGQSPWRRTKLRIRRSGRPFSSNSGEMTSFFIKI